MAGRKKKRGGDEEHENHERWLLTYADMITLLVAFFIMLYAMSIVNQTKFQQLALSVRSGFGSSMTQGAPTIFSKGGGLSGSPSITDSGQAKSSESIPNSLPVSPHDLAAHQDSQRLDKAYDIMHTYIQKNHLDTVMHVVRCERGVVVTVMTDKMLFARGEADLRPEELDLLTKIAAVADTVPNQVRVEGHTDNLPIHTLRFPSNWELSTTRATTVLRYFEAHDVASNRLEAAGYADQHPVASNDSEDNRGRNRRVDVVILKRF